MVIVPGFVIAIATFPGVIVHEAAHLLFCKVRGIAVLDVCFFRFGNPAGYVIHETPKDFTSSFLITIGPFLVNSVFCVLFCFPAFVPVRVFDVVDPLSGFLIWLGISIGMHAFPSTADAACLWAAAKKAVAERHFLAYAGFPLVLLIYAANILSFIWIDYFYGIALGFGLPSILLERLV
jgi:hypothetical protein